MNALRKNDLPIGCPECSCRGRSFKKLFFHLIKEHNWSEEEAKRYVSEEELKKSLL